MKNLADFDTSTLIYVILAIVAAIASMFQKKNQQKSEPTQETKRSDWKDIFEIPEVETNEQDFGTSKQKNEEIFTPEPVATKKEDRLFRAKSMETYIENEAFVHAPSYQFEDFIKKTEIGDIKEETSENRYKIDLKEAIIYSEIIQRKY